MPAEIEQRSAHQPGFDQHPDLNSAESSYSLKAATTESQLKGPKVGMYAQVDSILLQGSCLWTLGTQTDIIINLWYKQPDSSNDVCFVLQNLGCC